VHRGPVAAACPARRGKSIPTVEIDVLSEADQFYRKKKCDEIHPRCSDCRRLSLPCQWPSNSSVTTDIHDSSSPESQPEVRPAETDLIEVSDGDRMSTCSITPHDDDEFIATLFPHPLPEKNAVLLPTSRPLLSANPYLCSEEDRSLYNHYIHVVSRALSRSHDTDRNPFLITLLPLAAASDAVTSVILSLSGCHWRRVYPSIWGCALKRQGKGL